jgi:hypothetical protein
LFFSCRIYDNIDDVLALVDDVTSDFDCGGLVLIW